MDALHEFGFGFGRGVLFDGSESPGVEDVRGEFRNDVLDGFAAVFNVGHHEELNCHVKCHSVWKVDGFPKCMFDLFLGG